MQNAGIFTAANNTVIRWNTAISAKHIIQFGFQRIFHHAGAYRLHGPGMRFGRNICRNLHQFQLFGVFVQTHFIDQTVELHHLRWCRGATAAFAIGSCNPFGHPRIKFGILSNTVKELVFIQQFFQNFFIEQVNGIGFIGLILFNGTINTSTIAIPDFHLPVTFAAKQAIGIAFIYRFIGFNDRDRFRFCKAGQVEETAVRSIFIVSIPVTHGHRTGGNNGNTVWSHQFSQTVTTFFKFYLGQFLH